MDLGGKGTDDEKQTKQEKWFLELECRGHSFVTELASYEERKIHLDSHFLLELENLTTRKSRCIDTLILTILNINIFHSALLTSLSSKQ